MLSKSASMSTGKSFGNEIIQNQPVNPGNFIRNIEFYTLIPVFDLSTLVHTNQIGYCLVL